MASPKSRTLTRPSPDDHDVGGFEIAVHDAPVVGGGQCLGDLGTDLEDSIGCHAPLGNRPIERLTLHQLHGQEVPALTLLDRVDADHTRMIEGGEHRRFAAEAVEPFGVRRHFLGQHLESHFAAQLGVGGSVHRPHAARTELACDLVVGEG